MIPLTPIRRHLPECKELCPSCRIARKTLSESIFEDCIETYASILAVLLAEKLYVILIPTTRTVGTGPLWIHRNEQMTTYGHASDTQGFSNEIKCISTLELRMKYRPSNRRATRDTNKNAHHFHLRSTGVPKVIPISRKNLNAFYAAYHQLGWQLGPTDRMLQMFELTFDVSVVSPPSTR